MIKNDAAPYSTSMSNTCNTVWNGVLDEPACTSNTLLTEYVMLLVYLASHPSRFKI